MKGHPVIRYCWLVDTINNHGPISYAEIAARWEQSRRYDNNPLALRTFHNHREAVENLFDIRIECDDRTNKYYIKDKEALRSNEAASWMLNAFSISNLLGEAKSLGRRVQVEEVPSSQRYLSDLLNAMRENRRVAICYYPYNSSESFMLTLQPLIVKLYERRWYLYANKADDPKIKLYALDRIEECSVLDESFTLPEEFDPDAYTYNTFGVTIYDDIAPVKIRLRAKGRHAKYMRSLPLHHSQLEVETTAKYADFEYFVTPTPELYTKLLSYGIGVEVLEPRDVKQEMHKYILNMSFIYSDEVSNTKLGKAVKLALSQFPQADARGVKHALEMQRGISYIHHLDACIIYLEATLGWEYVKRFSLNDPDVLAMFQRGDTEGVYMCSSDAVRARLREAKIDSIDDIVEVYRNYHHPKTQPWPYDHTLAQTLISYFAVYVKCHYPREYEMFLGYQQ